MLSQVNSG